MSHDFAHTQTFKKEQNKTKTDNKGARLNVNPSGIFYGVGTSASTEPESELAVKGDLIIQ